MRRLPEITRSSIPFVFYGMVLIGLYLTSLYSYLLFHSLAEIFSIVIGSCIFILAWNSRHRLDNDYLLLLGIAFLFVSVLDLLHTLAYQGMGVFPRYDANLPTQLWITARYIQSISLLIAPVFLRHKLNVNLVFAMYAVVTIVVLIAIFTKIFPACFVVGRGLTQFKIISEYSISLILLAAIAFLFYHRAAFDRKVVQWLLASLILTIVAELTFTLYVSVYGLANLIGHFLKVSAFFLIYIAIVEMGIEKPQRLLFRNLQRKEEAFENVLQEVQRLAITDSLTNLYNRRHFSKVGEDEVQRACRYGRSLSAIMLDIDHFKRVNDTFGHKVGDQILQEVAKSCRRALRGVDVVGRYGGDEFVILLPENDRTAAVQVAERLRKNITHMQLNTTGGAVKVTASLGVASVDCDKPSLETLLSQADKALYVAKRRGRNRVSKA
jgi:diguanylate cyclase (GGDEF)-like protein